MLLMFDMVLEITKRMVLVFICKGSSETLAIVVMVPYGGLIGCNISNSAALKPRGTYKLL